MSALDILQYFSLPTVILFWLFTRNRNSGKSTASFDATALQKRKAWLQGIQDELEQSPSSVVQRHLVDKVQQDISTIQTLQDVNTIDAGFIPLSEK